MSNLAAPATGLRAHDGNAHATIALHKLPVQLRMLVRVMGEAAAYRLVQWRGGTPYTVSATMRSRQFAVLVEAVGIDAAGALVAELPGQTLQLPKYDAVLRQLRHQRVIELRGRGVLLAEVALATGYSVRQVINVINASGALAPQGLQPDLFGAESSGVVAAAG